MTSLDGRWEEAYDEEEGSCDGERSEEPGDESSDEIDGESPGLRVGGRGVSREPQGGEASPVSDRLERLSGDAAAEAEVVPEVVPEVLGPPCRRGKPPGDAAPPHERDPGGGTP